MSEIKEAGDAAAPEALEAQEAYIGQSNLLAILDRREADLNRRRVVLACELAEADGGLREILYLRQIVTSARAVKPDAGADADAQTAT